MGRCPYCDSKLITLTATHLKKHETTCAECGKKLYRKTIRKRNVCDTCKRELKNEKRRISNVVEKNLNKIIESFVDENDRESLFGLGNGETNEPIIDKTHQTWRAALD